MADHLEVSRNTVGRWLSGAGEPKRLYLRIWALRAGVPLEWIETGITPENNDGGDGSSMVNIYYLPVPSLELVA